MHTLYVALRPITPDDYERMIAIQRDQTPTPNSLDDLRRADARVQPGDIRYQIAACRTDGTMVGYGSAVHDHLDPAGKFDLNVRVDRPYARNGVGGMIYDALENFAITNGATVLEARVPDNNPRNWGWAQARGYCLKNHRLYFRRSLPDFDPTPFMKSVTDAEAAGIRFGNLADYPQTDEWLHRFFDFMWPLHNDIPGHEPQPRPSFNEEKKTWLERPNWDPAGVVLAIDGDKWAAVSHVNRELNGELINALTAVSPEYRGRGLAMAVKIKSMEYAKGQGAAYIRTRNHADNVRMLAVNRRLGYQPESGIYHIAKLII